MLGISSWDVHALRGLRDELLERLAKLTTSWKTSSWDGRWPSSKQGVAMIPKQDVDPRPTGHKPVMLAAMVSRIWSSIRARAYLKHLGELTPKGIRMAFR
jgi:hypothetical protein